MKFLSVIIVVCIFVSESQSTSSEQADSPSSNKTSVTSEQKKWNIKLDINFSKSLPPVVRKPPRSDVRFKCEAIMNFTKVEAYTKNKESVATTLQDIPEHILQGLMKNVKVYWRKDKIIIGESPRVKITTRVDKTNGTVATNLRIRGVEAEDQGNYTCVIKQMYEKKQSSRLIVEKGEGIENYELPTYTQLFPNADVRKELDVNVRTTDMTSEGIKSNATNTTKSLTPQKLEPICQEYVGKICEAYLQGQFVYIPYDTTQPALEDKLVKAVQVTKYSTEISLQCAGYALPSLCYSTFPICRDPMVTNDNFFKEAKKVFTILSATNTNTGSDDPAVVFESNEKNISIENLNYRHNSTVLRRVCKQDCEILENELCQMEYAIAKRHPHIGQQLTLEECQDLPEDDPHCLKIGVGAVMVSDDECYWETGKGYLGQVNVADNGMPCIEWSKQLSLKLSDYPELAGRHSYCRNPQPEEKPQPWCFVDKEGKTEQLCDIPKCARKIWIYIVIVFLLLTLTIVGFIICVYYRHRNKNNGATIRDINLPNADKNIYGNRLNSPMEMNELMNNQNSSNQPHFTRSTRGNGAIRVPQYSLSQIKFLEELGEGAFGKVYKGALKKNGETQYVAVKALKENASAKTQADFRREIDLISELTHENIVCIVGVALREEPLCMLFEFMARGDLHEFLMGRAPPSGKGLPPLRLLNIAQNIAAGMHYLASHHYVHRDLAARNCLVSDDFVVKISDFGLSRDIYSSDYYRVQSKSLLPVRWMPPESILYGKFTTESDIWSYGVVLWEIYSYGLQPYYGYSNQEVIAMVRAGEVLAPPHPCPPAVHALMRDCWRHQPQRRPAFEHIVTRVSEWIEMGGCPETAPSDSSTCGHRTIGSSRDLQEKVPLLPPHCSSSNGSLTGSLKFTAAGSSVRMDDSCSLRKFPAGAGVRDDSRSTCSDVPPLAPKAKKHSSGSLDFDRVGKETVVRIPNSHFGNEI